MNLLYITGGIGDTCAFTSAISKLDNPVSVIGPWYKIFLTHPNVVSVYNSTNYRAILNNEFFYKHFDNIIFLDSIHNKEFVKNNIHICESAHTQLQLKNETNENEFYFSDLEKTTIDTINKKYPNLVLIQYESATHKPEIKCYKNLSVATAQNLTNFLNLNNFNVLEVTNQKPTLKNTINGEIENILNYKFLFDYRDYLLAMQCCKFFVSIDSVINHYSSNKFNKKLGLVFWGSTSQKRFGYDHNINLKTRAPDSMYFTKEDIETSLHNVIKNVL